MNRSINSVLEAIRQTLVDDTKSRVLDKAALSEMEAPEPEAAEPTASGASAGSSGAQNVDAVGSETLEFYISNIVDNIVQTYEIDDEDAFDLVMDVIEDLEKEGVVPPMPSGEDAEEVAIWLGKAKTLMLDSFIYDCMETDDEDNPETGGVE